MSIIANGTFSYTEGYPALSLNLQHTRSSPLSILFCQTMTVSVSEAPLVSLGLLVDGYNHRRTLILEDRQRVSIGRGGGGGLIYKRCC